MPLVRFNFLYICFIAYLRIIETGTAAGDPTEANWVGATCKRDDDIFVGSVKGNVGHLEVAAFLASLSKVCSIFTTGVIPPNVNLVDPNPAIKVGRIQAPRAQRADEADVPPVVGKSLISIGSSGIGGSNGHVVLESPPSRTETKVARAEKPAPVLLVSGGLSPRSATSVARRPSRRLGSQMYSTFRRSSTMLGRTRTPDDVPLVRGVYARPEGSCEIPYADSRDTQPSSFGLRLLGDRARSM